MSNCCKTSCCIGAAEMNCGERQRFFLDLGEWLESVGGSKVKSVNWVSEGGCEEHPLIFEAEPYNPVTGILSVMIEGGAANSSYEAVAFIDTEDCQRTRQCFTVFVKEC